MLKPERVLAFRPLRAIRLYPDLQLAYNNLDLA
jgi:hypothetical protein